MGPRRSITSLVTAVLVLAGCSDGDQPSPSPSPDRPAEGIALTSPRAVHRAVPLPDGTVLLLGGCSTRGCGGFDLAQTSEVVDPVSGRAAPGARMAQPRASASATSLRDGRVLVVGGYPGEGRAPTGSIEVYDPASATFTTTSPLRVARADHSATLMPDGRVLVVGGFGPDGVALTSVEVVDPVEGTVAQGPSLTTPRAAHAATLVGDDVVLVGGTSATDALASTELLRDGEWRAGPDLVTPRVKHAAVTLEDGRVLVVGGSTTTQGRELLGTTELLLTATGAGPGRVEAGPSLASPQYKLDGAVVVLPDGRVVVAGGPRLEVFDPVTGTMAVVEGSAQPRRSFVTATVTGAATVLVAGGYDDAVVPSASARVVDVSADG